MGWRGVAAWIGFVAWLGFAVGAGGALAAGGKDLRRFASRPTVWRLIDRHVAKRPAKTKENVLGDGFRAQFTRRMDNGLALRGETLARDINSLGEIPDSAWYQNRIGRAEISAEDLFWGPCDKDGSMGPEPGSRLAVFAAKTVGANPGFLARDQRGGRYLVKFDPPHAPEMQTGADLVGNRLFWALGYHVPCDSIFVFRREDLVIDPETEVLDALTKKKRPMEARDLDAILAKVARRDDGSYRCQLSRFVPGIPVGPVAQSGVRGDDPNDRIPHEERRSFRGLRVFAAWVKHTDLKLGNTLSAYVTEGDRSFLRHYLVDFGEIFAGQAGEQGYMRDGYQYNIDPGAILRSFLLLGLWVEPWERIEDSGYTAIGPFESKNFRFYGWKPLLPNRFMNRMNDLDAFWALRKLAALSEEHLKAAVKAGQYSDPGAADYLLEVLLERRQIIAREVLPRVNPVYGFRVDNGVRLSFRDLALDLGHLEPVERTWRVESCFIGRHRSCPGKVQLLSRPVMDLETPAAEEQLVVRLQALSHGRARGQAVHLHLDRLPGRERISIVGIDRWRTGQVK